MSHFEPVRAKVLGNNYNFEITLKCGHKIYRISKYYETERNKESKNLHELISRLFNPLNNRQQKLNESIPEFIITCKECDTISNSSELQISITIDKDIRWY